MELKKRVNTVRSAVMWRLTRKIGSSQQNRDYLTPPTKEFKNILISRPNHRLGNLLLITPILQEVMATFPKASIDLFVKGKAAQSIFKNYTNIGRIIRVPAKPFTDIFNYLKGWTSLRKTQYDLVINVVYHSSSGRLSTRFAKTLYRCFGDVSDAIKAEHEDCEHVAKHPVYSFRDFIKRIGIKASEEDVLPLNLLLSSDEIEEGKRLLHNIVDKEKKTICIFTYATGAKCYPPSWWEPFYTRLKSEFPDYNIVEMLPVENVSQIDFKAPSFYSKDIRQIGSFIANTDIFIGADSGMMHLASSAQVPTVGLFKVTNPLTFGPYGNNSVAIDTNNTNLDDWMGTVAGILNKEAQFQNPQSSSL